jgi:nicotinate phosphoribosyltransferase
MTNVSTPSPPFVDAFSLTMACAYFRTGRHMLPAVCYLSLPETTPYALVCGVERVTDELQAFGFSPEVVQYISEMLDNTGKPLFDASFLEMLFHTRWQGTLHAVPEGSYVFAGEPIVRIEAPIYQCVLVESLLRNSVGYESAIATRTADLVAAASPTPIIERGMAYAPGIDASIAASRAAYIGGCAAATNVLAGDLFDIPLRGGFTELWSDSFDDEFLSYVLYAGAMPANCTLRVDVQHAQKNIAAALNVGKQLSEHGFSLTGIRLENGTLSEIAAAAIMAKKSFIAAKMPNVAIVVAGDFSAAEISMFHRLNTPINVFLLDNALLSVLPLPLTYKVAAVQLELNQPLVRRTKTWATQPQVYRFRDAEGVYVGDLRYDEAQPPSLEAQTLGAFSAAELAKFEGFALLSQLFEKGKYVAFEREIAQIRAYAQQERTAFAPAVFADKREYPVGLAI